MKRLSWKPEPLLYAAALLLALVVRFAGTGQPPLDNREAGLALQALALAHGETPLLSPHPAYLALTGLWFFLFGDWNLTARFWPALAGSLLVLAPALFRGQLGRLPALVLAFGLALDPAMLAVSRQAGSLALALLLLVLAWGLWLRGKTILAGTSAGLALLCGPELWPGALSLGIAAWIANELSTSRAVRPNADNLTPVERTAAGDGHPTEALAAVEDGLPRRPSRLYRFGLAALAAVFFAGTLFFTVPQGLSAAAGGIPAYLSGWAVSSGVPALRLLLALLLYEFLPLLFGLWGALRGLLSRSATPRAAAIDRFLLLWWAAALLLALAYPGREVTGIAWSLLPLWALAARQLIRTVSIPALDHLPTLGQALLAAVILAFLSMSLATMTNNFQPANLALYWVRIAGAVVLLIASSGLIAWGWSRAVALKGLALGCLIILGLYTLSAGWNSAGLSGKPGPELWSGEAVTADSSLLADTIRDLNILRLPETGDIDLVIVGRRQPALDWLVRGARNVHHASLLSSESRPALVITPLDPELALSASYRGQGFTLSQSTDWDALGLPDWWRWLVYRRLPQPAAGQSEQVILWARSDLFPGGAEQAQNAEDPAP